MACVANALTSAFYVPRTTGAIGGATITTLMTVDDLLKITNHSWNMKVYLNGTYTAVGTVGVLALVPTTAGFSRGKKSEEASGNGDDANHVEFCEGQWGFCWKCEVLDVCRMRCDCRQWKKADKFCPFMLEDVTDSLNNP